MVGFDCLMRRGLDIVPRRLSLIFLATLRGSVSLGGSALRIRASSGVNAATCSVLLSFHGPPSGLGPILLPTKLFARLSAAYRLLFHRCVRVHRFPHRSFKHASFPQDSFAVLELYLTIPSTLDMFKWTRLSSKYEVISVPRLQRHIPLCAFSSTSCCVVNTS
ncbi:hypothetical protein C8R47DRAFT_185660 [Mycena vitilis]|nr:hypothetical protein C8R47DRAFT_185660 [Mycena vitilis]